MKQFPSRLAFAVIPGFSCFQWIEGTFRRKIFDSGISSGFMVTVFWIWSGCFIPITGFADRIGSINFEEFEDHVVITDAGGTGELLIPEKINGKVVTEIADLAFERCQLDKIIIPIGIRVIGQRAFKDSTFLTEFEVRDGSPYLATLDGVLFSKDQSELIVFPMAKPLEGGVYTVPQGVTSIRSFAFEGSSLTRISLPSTLQQIGERAFFDCRLFTGVDVDANNATFSSLDGILFDNSKQELVNFPMLPLSGTIVVPPGVERIGSYAFYDTPIVELTLPEGITHIGEFAFFNCENLKTLRLPNSLVSIEDRAFAGCSDLLDPSLGNNLGFIGEAAFEGCSSLYLMTIPPLVSELSDFIFKDCTYLNRIWFLGVIEKVGNQAFYRCGNLTIVDFPAGLKSVGDEAFKFCSILGLVTLRSGLTSLGKGAFQENGVLKEITLPDTLTKLGDSVFSECKALGTVNLPGSLDFIPANTFLNCWALEKIRIPSGIASIGSGAFRRCWALHTVEIEEGLFFINDYAFFESWKLKTIDLPNSLIGIKDGAFAETDIESILIPLNVSSISSSAFSRCNSLQRIYFMGNAPVIEGDLDHGNGEPKIYYFEDKEGFGSPDWKGLPAVGMGSFSNLKVWLLDTNFPPTAEGVFIQSYQGFPAMLSYAFNQPLGLYDYPEPQLSDGSLKYSFFGNREGIIYSVEISKNLVDWSNEGVSISEPDADGFRLASVDLEDGRCFVKFRIEES